MRVIGLLLTALVLAGCGPFDAPASGATFSEADVFAARVTLKAMRSGCPVPPEPQSGYQTVIADNEQDFQDVQIVFDSAGRLVSASEIGGTLCFRVLARPFEVE